MPPTFWFPLQDNRLRISVMESYPAALHTFAKCTVGDVVNDCTRKVTVCILGDSTLPMYNNHEKLSPTERFKGKAKFGTIAPLEKVYHAMVAGDLSPQDKRFQMLKEPLHYTRHADGPGGLWTKPADVRLLLVKYFEEGQCPWKHRPGTTPSVTWVEVVLREGKNRQIRRLCNRSGLDLRRLHRVSVGPIIVGDVEEGYCRELTRREVCQLYAYALPKDPLVPTKAAVESVLKQRLTSLPRTRLSLEEKPVPPIACLQHEGGGSRWTMPLSLCRTSTSDSNHGKVCSTISVGKSQSCSRTEETRESTASMCALEERCGTSFGFLVQNIMSFALRFVHEVDPGASEEEFESEPSDGRSVHPDEKHMLLAKRPGVWQEGVRSYEDCERD
ncbi:unnamed protein product [Choristocarpus tenellus]